MANPSRIQKHHYLLVKFFGVADNPLEDVNPYTSVSVFRRSNIGSLRWGSTDDFASRTKDRVAWNLQEIVGLDGVTLKYDDIRPGLNKSNTLIEEVVYGWAGKARYAE